MSHQAGTEFTREAISLSSCQLLLCFLILVKMLDVLSSLCGLYYDDVVFILEMNTLHS